MVVARFYILFHRETGERVIQIRRSFSGRIRKADWSYMPPGMLVIHERTSCTSSYIAVFMPCSFKYRTASAISQWVCCQNCRNYVSWLHSMARNDYGHDVRQGVHIHCLRFSRNNLPYFFPVRSRKNMTLIEFSRKKCHERG